MLSGLVRSVLTNDGALWENKDHTLREPQTDRNVEIGTFFLSMNKLRAYKAEFKKKKISRETGVLLEVDFNYCVTRRKKTTD